MTNSNLANEVLHSFQMLDGTQQNEVLDYIKNIKPELHSKKLYRRRAMKQIREALMKA